MTFCYFRIRVIFSSFIPHISFVSSYLSNVDMHKHVLYIYYFNSKVHHWIIVIHIDIVCWIIDTNSFFSLSNWMQHFRIYSKKGFYRWIENRCWPWALFWSLVGLLSLLHIRRFHSIFYTYFTVDYNLLRCILKTLLLAREMYYIHALFFLFASKLSIAEFQLWINNMKLTFSHRIVFIMCSVLAKLFISICCITICMSMFFFCLLVLVFSIIKFKVGNHWTVNVNHRIKLAIFHKKIHFTMYQKLYTFTKINTVIIEITLSNNIQLISSTRNNVKNRVISPVSF